MGTRSAGDELIYSITPCSLFLRVVKLLLLAILHRDVKSWEKGEYSNDILGKVKCDVYGTYQTANG